jgi:hypothetical protein
MAVVFMVKKELFHNNELSMTNFKEFMPLIWHKNLKILRGVFALFLFASCQDTPLSKKPILNEIPNIWAIEDSSFQHLEGFLLKSGKPFSGYQFALFPNGDTVRIAPYFKGKEQGWVKTFYPHKQLETLRFYETGKKEGEHRGYWESGQLKFIFNFKNDLHEGSAKEWGQTGRIYRDFNYKNGQEEGLQRIWYADGTIGANYEAKNGRNYGLTGVKNCVSTHK